MTFEEHLRVRTNTPENTPCFSFREYLSHFGIRSEEDIQFHVTRVLRMEEVTGLKMRLDWYDPYKESP